jgi:DNA-binding CsgD family transcriptional regulator
MSEYRPIDMAPDEQAWIIYNPFDTIEANLLCFKQDVDEGGFPTGGEQRRLLVDLRRYDDEEAAKALINRHMGLIAAVVYPFRDFLSSEELMQAGGEALIEAAKSYDRNEQEDFSDHAILTMHGALSGRFPEADTPPYDDPEYRPMERIYRYVAVLNKDPAAQVLQEAAIRAGEIQPKMTAQEREKNMKWLESILSPDEFKLMAAAHLTDREASIRTGVTYGSIPTLLGTARKKLGVETRTEMALYLTVQGMEFDVPKPPADTRFTAREKLIGSLLEKRNPEIEAIIGLGPKATSTAISALLRKTGAKTRPELALICQKYPLKLTEEDAEEIPDALEGFTYKQREVAKRLHLPYNEITEELDYEDTNTVHNIKDRTMEDAGAESPTELALRLHHRGLKYDIRKPKRPLVELMDSTDMLVASCLGLSNDLIAAYVDIPYRRVGHIIEKSKNKTGARTRVELALMMATFDTGERRDREPTPRERLAARLGVEALDSFGVSVLFEHCSERERRVITGYYLRDKPTSWKKVAAEEGISVAMANGAVGTVITRIHRLGIKLVAEAEDEPIQEEELAQAA